jgi:hypothetical protein
LTGTSRWLIADRERWPMIESYLQQVPPKTTHEREPEHMDRFVFLSI